MVILLAVAILALGGLAAFLRQRVVPADAEVLIVEGFGPKPPTVERAPVWIWRYLARIERVPLLREALVFERSGDDPVACRALSRANLRATVEVALKDDPIDVLHLARALGADAVTPEGAHALMEPKVLAALGAVAAHHRADELDDHMTELGHALQELLGCDWWGLTVVSVTAERILSDTLPASEGPFR